MIVRITQKDIARKLGISSSLVSRALAGTAPAIGADPTTVQRIQETARALGYSPSAAARQLRGAGQPVLGLAVMDLQDPFFGPAVAEVIQQSHRAGYAISLAGFDHRRVNESDVQLLLQLDLKALMVLGSGDIAWTDRFLKRGIPVVRIGGGALPAGAAHVTVDESWGMKLIVDHLAGNGHRQLAFIGAELPVHQNRLHWVRHHAKRHRITLLPRMAILAGPDVLEAGVLGVERLAQACGGEWPSAIICSSDTVALGALRGVARHGLRVPEHVSLTGYDDLALAALATPPLTSVRQPLADMVAAALRIVSAGKPGISPPAHRPTLVLRASTTSAWHA